MIRRQFLSHVLGHGLVGVTVCGTTGCGTLLYPERHGQPHSPHIDWKVVALDGLGLLLFFVPGVIAFVVDFSTGAIYLPWEETYPDFGMHEAKMPRQHSAMLQTTITSQSELPAQPLGLKRVSLSHEQMNLNRIEQLASDHVGKDVSLENEKARLSTLARLDQFDRQLTRHHSDHGFGHAIRSFFERRIRG